MSSTLENHTKVEINLNSIDKRLMSSEVLFDDAKCQKLLKDLLGYLINFDTVHTLEEAGIHLYQFPHILKHLLLPLIKSGFITFVESNQTPKYILVQVNNNDLKATENIAYVQGDESVHFDGLNVFLHFDTVDFKGTLGSNTAYYQESTQELAGRGACDDKGQLAAMIILLYRLYFEAISLPGNISSLPLNLFVFSDEELGNILSKNTVKRIEGNIIDAEPTSLIRRAVIDRLKTCHDFSGVANTLQIASAAMCAVRQIYESSGFDVHTFAENGSALAVLYISVLTADSPADVVEELALIARRKLKEFDALFLDNGHSGIESSVDKKFVRLVRKAMGVPVVENSSVGTITGQSVNKKGNPELWGHYGTSMFNHNPTGLVTSVRDLGRHTSNERVNIPELHEWILGMEKTYYAMQEG